MSEMQVQAPANVKIGGEHSVVYGGPSISAAIGLFATATITDTGNDKLEIVLKDLKLSISLDASRLRSLYKDYSSRDTTKSGDLARYIEKNQGIGKELLPYATIAGRLLVEQGVNPIGKKVVIHSDVPIQKGYASSAVCSTAFAMALIKASGKKVDDATAIDICRDGERIVHKAETAGRIDVGPAYFGGYARFTGAKGVEKEKISTPVNIIVIDTGPKPPTSEMVKVVREMYNANTEATTKVLREIDSCVEKEIIALKAGDLKELGKQMYRNHQLLAKLGVSSGGLDKAVSIAMSNGAYGAKLCGGGGGGMGIAIVGSPSEAEKVIKALKEAGFNSYSTSITLKGASV